jgi:hypothetical protein
MTSPSRRNRRTTASSTRRRTPFSRITAAIALSGALAAGLQAEAAEPARRASPLDRLQGRSAASRWEEARSQWGGTRQAVANQPATVAPPLDAVITEPASDEPKAHPVVADEAEAFGPPRQDETAPAAPAEPRFDPFDVVADEAAQTLAPADQSDIQRLTSPAHRDPAASALLSALQAPPPDVPPADYGLDSPSSQLDVTETPEQAFKPISAIQPFYDYSPEGDDPCQHLCPLPGMCPDDPNLLCPDDGPIPLTGSTQRFFPHLEFYWAASNLHHNPLYFENPALERYGHVHHNDCVEPAFSMARFGVQVVSLPYQIALDPVWRRQYDLGWYRPGDFTPKLIYQPPLNARAAATAAGVYTGLSFLLFP